MIQSKNPEVKEQTKRRLARIEGQLRGVQKMIDDERDCREVLQQLIAIRSGIQSASLNFLQEVAAECLLDLETEEDPTNSRETMAALIKMLGKVT
jgi:CsoR family transcriptional regulator, copper-sensing transcriptional repressor